jgi:glycosyltransferase involved in cell wall biosynthesis
MDDWSRLHGAALSDLKRPGLSIVLPAYNEEANVALAVMRMIEAADRCSKRSTSWSSTTAVETPQGAFEDRSRRSARRLLQHPVNRGYGAAVTTGLRRSSPGLLYGFDLQFDSHRSGTARRIDHLRS